MRAFCCQFAAGWSAGVGIWQRFARYARIVLPVRGGGSSSGTAGALPSGGARQADDRGRGRRGAQQRHDHRHRRLGVAPQADVAGPGHPAQRAEGPSRGELRRTGRRSAVRRGPGPQAHLRVRVARLDPARAPLPDRPPDRLGGGPRVRRGRLLPGAAGRHPPGALLPDPGRAGLRHAHLQPGPQDGDEPLRRRHRAGGCSRLRHRRVAGAHEPGRRRRQRAVPRSRPVLRRPVRHGGQAHVHVVRAARGHRGPAEARDRSTR